MVIRYNFHIENFTRYLVTGTVDSDALESSLYIMKAYLVMYTGLRQLRLFTTPIRLLIDPYYKTPATTSTRFHIPLQLHSSLIPTYPAATSFLTHSNIPRCNFIPHSSLHIPLQLQLLPYFRKQLRSCSCPSQIPLYREFCVGVHVFIFLSSSLLSTAIPHNLKK
jgi:hypothetical protein